MANTYHQIYLQIVFAAKYKSAIIAKEWRPDLLRILGNLINETGCRNIIVNGVEDHVHCFCSLKPIVAVPDLVKTIKAKSSKHINERSLTPSRFEWQEGYGVFSYGHSQIDSVYKYIAAQEEHHKNQTFHEEYLEFLQHFQVPYDDRYLFHELK
jgi:putative transposase